MIWYSIAVIIKDIKILITVRYQVTPIPVTKQVRALQVLVRMEEGRHSYGGYVKGQNHFESNLAMTNKGCPPNKSVSRCPPRETLKAVLMEIKMVIMVLFYKDKEVERTYLSRKRDKLWFIITINAYG